LYSSLFTEYCGHIILPQTGKSNGSEEKEQSEEIPGLLDIAGFLGAVCLYPSLV